MDETAELFPERTELARLFPEYRVVDQLAMTAMSVVYLAEEIPMAGRLVALKVLHPNLARDESFRQRFRQEPWAAARLGHPNVIPILRAEERGGVCLLSTPYVAGRDLARLIRSNGPLEMWQAVDIVGQIAAALDAARERGLVHRDVKPSNILLNQHAWHTWHAFLCDFGIAKLVSGTRVTMQNELLGTAQYMSPEQHRGRDVDHRSDQYSLACVAFECLTGAPPYARADDSAVAHAHLHEDIPSVTEHRAQVPQAVDAVIGKALSKEPENRYPTSGAFATALKEASLQGGTGGPPHPQRPPIELPSPRIPSRRRLVMIGTAAVALVVIAATVAWSVLSPTDDAEKLSPAQLERVPVDLRGGCSRGDVSLLGAVETLTCRASSGQSAQIGLFDTDGAATAAYEGAVRDAGVKTGTGDCERAMGAEHRYPAAGPPKGRLLCHQRDAATVLTWHDTATRTVARAESTESGLIDSWNTWVGTPVFPTSAERQLIDRTGNQNCRRAAADSFAEFPGADTGIECRPGLGVAYTTAYRFRDAADIRRRFEARVAAARASSKPSCLDRPAGFLGSGDYYLFGMDAGGLLCYRKGGDYVLEWTTEPLLVYSRAVAKDPGKLMKWWKDDEGPTRNQLAKAFAELADPPFPTAAEKALLAHIPAPSRVNCLRPPAVTIKRLVPKYTVTAVMCGPTRGAERVFYFQFADLPSLRADYGEVDPALPDCSRNPPKFHGEHPYRLGKISGFLHCKTDDDGDRSLLWTAEQLRIEVWADVAALPPVALHWWRTEAGPR